MLVVVVQRHRGRGRDSRRRRCGCNDHRRRVGRLRMTSMAVCMGDARAVVTVSHAGNHARRRRKHNDNPEAGEHRRVDERRNRIAIVTSIPDPAGSHDDVELEQKRAKVSGLHELRFSCVRTEGCSSGPR